MTIVYNRIDTNNWVTKMNAFASSKTIATSKLANDRVQIEFNVESPKLNICGVIELRVEDAWSIIQKASLDSLTKMYIDTSQIHLENVDLYANFVRWQGCTIDGENDGTLIVTANWFEDPNTTKFVIERECVDDIIRCCFELVEKSINERKATLLKR